MPEPRPPQRSPLSVGIGWAYRVSALGLEFVLPILIGYWVDEHFGTRPGGMLVGAVLGFTVGLTHLIQIARQAPRD